MATSRSGLAALFFVYIVWGSSFLAIRIALSGAGAFGPFTLATVRTLGAGLALLLFGLLRGPVPRPAALAWLAGTGLILWVGGHALLVWAEGGLDSGLSALIYSSTPLWAALLEGARGKSVRAWPVLAGFAGVALVLPLGGGVGAGLWLNGAALLLSAFFWALGTVMGDGPAAGVPLALAAGVQLTAAGLVTAAWAVLAREPWPAPNPHAWLACLHLTITGTVLAYLAYAHAQRTLPVAWVMSFGYVSPVVAVVLGVLVLGEAMTLRTGLGMALVVVSVIWLFAGPAPARGKA